MSTTTLNVVPPYLNKIPQFKVMWNNVHEYDSAEIVLVVGRTGSGKSCFNLFGCDCMDVSCTYTNNYNFKPRFSLERCHFFAKDFITDITKMKENNEQFYPKGTCFMFDEANVENTNTDWMDMKAKAIATALQTNRKFNYVIWMTSPDFASLAIGTRRRVTAIVQMLNKKKMINGRPHALAKFEWLDYDNITGKPYFKLHRYWKAVELQLGDDGEPIIIWRKKKSKKVWVPLVRSSLEKPYNEIKSLALRKWYDKISEDLSYMKGYIGDGKKYTVKVLLDLFVENGKIDWEKICDDRGNVFDFLVEQKLIDNKYEGVSVKDLAQVVKILKIKKRKEDAEKKALKKEANENERNKKE